MAVGGRRVKLRGSSPPLTVAGRSTGTANRASSGRPFFSLLTPFPSGRISHGSQLPSRTESLLRFWGCYILVFRCSKPTPTRLHPLVTGIGALLQTGRGALVERKKASSQGQPTPDEWAFPFWGLMRNFPAPADACPDLVGRSCREPGEGSGTCRAETQRGNTSSPD
jgi:hypothetical protein